MPFLEQYFKSNLRQENDVQDHFYEESLQSSIAND